MPYVLTLCSASSFFTFVPSYSVTWTLPKAPPKVDLRPAEAQSYAHHLAAAKQQSSHQLVLRQCDQLSSQACVSPLHHHLHRRSGQVPAPADSQYIHI